VLAASQRPSHIEFPPVAASKEVLPCTRVALGKIDDDATIPLLIELNAGHRLERITGLKAPPSEGKAFWQKARAKQPDLFKIKEHRSYYPEKRGLFQLGP
jgi:hypothetical protein